MLRLKKIYGITLGRLQKKAIRLVVMILAVAVLVFTGVTIYQNNTLVSIVEDTRSEQQQAISQTSKATLDQYLGEILVSSTELRAQIANTDFSEVVDNIHMLQTIAQGLFENRGLLPAASVSLPDPALDGTTSAMALYEDNVDYTQSELLGIAAHMSSPMIALQQSSDKIDCCYIGLADGTGLFADAKAGNKYDENGRLITIPIRERRWYRGAVETGGLYFSGILENIYGDSLIITCSAPVVAKDELIGVVGIDIALERLVPDTRKAASFDFSYYILNAQGQVIMASDENGVFSVARSEDAPDLRQSGSEALSRFIAEAYEHTTPLTALQVDGKDYYMVGAPIKTTGWTLVTALATAVNEQLETQLLAEYDTINNSASAEFATRNSRTNQMTVLIILCVLLLGMVAALIATRRMVSPIVDMTKSIIRSGETGEPFEMTDRFRTNDEIEGLALAYDDLTKKTQKYIQNLTEITREKERVSTELQMATQIQAGMLPRTFPAFPDRAEFDIYATMDPAREVGGDFYDFFLIDDNHLCMVMADVSGKGVPAALFMMASKIIIQSCAMLGRGAAEILNKTNEAICSNNQTHMFVTTWIGILEISTGKLVAANAGHEYPAIYRHGQRFELFKDKHSFVIGGLDGVKYHDYELTMNPGDKLFLYTDGVPEATNASSEMFGTGRMLDALNAAPDADLKAILGNVRTAVDGFVKDAEQFDDMTMLCMVYKGIPGDKAAETPAQ